MNIDDLISQYLDGELSPEAEAELHHRLSVSPEDRRLFREQIALHALAHDARLLDRPGRALERSLFTQLHRDEGMSQAAIPSDVAYAHMAAPVPGAPARAAAPPRRRRRMVAVLLPLLVAALGTSLVLMLDDGAGEPTGTLAVEERSPAQSRSEAPAPDHDVSDRALADAGGAELEPRPQSESVAAPDRPATTDGGLAARQTDRIGDRLNAASDRLAPSRRNDAGQLGATRSAELDAALAAATPVVVPNASDRTVAAVDRGAEGSGAAESVTPRDPRAPVGGIQSEGLGNGLLAAPPSGPALAIGPETPRSAAATRSSSPRSSAAAESVKQDSVAETFSIAEPVVEPATRSSFAVLSALQQNMLVGSAEEGVQPELNVRIGGAFNDGGHAVFGIVGYGGYTETRTVVNQRVDTSIGLRGVPELDTTTGTNRSLEGRTEIWGGLGYRFSGRLNEHWSLGVGVWAGLGSRYSRMAAELPLAYRVGRSVRVELTPSIQYVSTRAAAATAGEVVSLDVPSTNFTESEVSEVPESDVRAGIGIGVTVYID